jgi:hypothetical protein
LLLVDSVISKYDYTNANSIKKRSLYASFEKFIGATEIWTVLQQYNVYNKGNIAFRWFLQFQNITLFRTY